MSFRVSLRPSGHELEVERDESVLDAALREGIGIPYGCRNGTCNSCRAKILEGEISYGSGLPKALTQTQADAGWALLCQATPLTDLVVEAQEFSSAAEFTIRSLPCRVKSKIQIAHDVMVLELQLPEGERLQFLAGQYVDILLRDGRRRSFSLANAARGDGSLSLHVRHVPDGEFSSHVFSHLKERALIRVRGPLGGFFLREASPRTLIFLAGGTGFAPIKSIIESALESKVSQPMYLYWGVRAKRDLYMHEMAEAWDSSNPNLTYVPVLSDPQTEDGWTARTGFVHQAVLDDFNDLTDCEVYSSGPPIMVDTAWQTFADRGLLAEHHFSDAFEFAYETGADTI